MSVLDRYADHFLPRYSNYPQGRYISLLLVRKVESEAIFRTEGSGEPLNKEFVHLGLAGGEIESRVVISKRKQTAVERRTGREKLREYGLLMAKGNDPKNGVCSLNRNNPCEKCIDCMIYGYAAGGGGAQKSRVVTDDAFSLHPASLVTGTRQFNALFDNSTMRDPEPPHKPSTSIGTDEYVKPETVFLDIETLRDLTVDEFHYVLGNVLRSGRYGAISSRIGKTKNILAGIIFSDCELFSNLELTQKTYDLLSQGRDLDFPLHETAVVQAVKQAATALQGRVVGRLASVPDEDMNALLDELVALYGDRDVLEKMLREVTAMYGGQA